MLPPALHRAGDAPDRVEQMRDQREDELCDRPYDAFMAFWRGAESERGALWAAYLAAQDDYEAYLLSKE